MQKGKERKKGRKECSDDQYRCRYDSEERVNTDQVAGEAGRVCSAGIQNRLCVGCKMVRVPDC
jgi:hypothetical protein